MDQVREENASHPDHAVDVVDVDQVAADAQAMPHPDVDEPDIGGGEIMPGDRADEWAQKERKQIVRLEPVAPWTVGAGVDPGERHSKQSRKHGRTGADQKRIDE